MHQAPQMAGRARGLPSAPYRQQKQKRLQHLGRREQGRRPLPWPWSCGSSAAGCTSGAAACAWPSFFFFLFLGLPLSPGADSRRFLAEAGFFGLLCFCEPQTKACLGGGSKSSAT